MTNRERSRAMPGARHALTRVWEEASIPQSAPSDVLRDHQFQEKEGAEVSTS